MCLLTGGPCFTNRVTRHVDHFILFITLHMTRRDWLDGCINRIRIIRIRIRIIVNFFFSSSSSIKTLMLPGHLHNTPHPTMSLWRDAERGADRPRGRIVPRATRACVRRRTFDHPDPMIVAPRNSLPLMSATLRSASTPHRAEGGRSWPGGGFGPEGGRLL